MKPFQIFIIITTLIFLFIKGKNIVKAIKNKGRIKGDLLIFIIILIIGIGLFIFFDYD